MVVFVCQRCYTEFQWNKPGRALFCNKCVGELTTEMMEKLGQCFRELFTLRLKIFDSWTEEDRRMARGQAIWVLALETLYVTEFEDFLKQAERQGISMQTIMRDIDNMKTVYKEEIKRIWFDSQEKAIADAKENKA